MRFLPIFLLLTGCSSYISTLQEEHKRSSISYDEMRIEIADLKHALHATQVELNIVEERVKKQEGLLIAQSKTPQGKNDPHEQQIALLEGKYAQLQKNQDLLLRNIEQLHTHAQETTQSLHSLAQQLRMQNQKFDEISKLKNTLSSLTQSFDSQEIKSTTYRVQPGDTLEKIARLRKTTVAELKRLNQLDNDRIAIGQELKLSP